jgi:hypothetical protein
MVRAEPSSSASRGRLSGPRPTGGGGDTMPRPDIRSRGLGRPSEQKKTGFFFISSTKNLNYKKYGKVTPLFLKLLNFFNNREIFFVTARHKSVHSMIFL